MFSLKDYNKLRNENRPFLWRDFFNKRVITLSTIWIAAICMYHVQLQRQRLLSLRNLIAENEFLSWTECPASIDSAKGLYANDEVVDEALQNVVLLTAANLGYYPMLQTWESYASAANLKWAVLSLDEWVVQHHKGVNTIPTHPGFFQSRSQRYSSKGYHQLGCNKWRSVLSILERCQVDIIFSDVDNLFLQDPFSDESDLGQKLRSPNQYDYIYSTPFPLSEQNQMECGNDFPKTGNTGFYFIRHDNAYLKDAIRQTLSVCREENFRLNDETIFWNIIREARRDQEWYHCDNTKINEPIITTTTVGETMEEEDSRTTAAADNDFYHRTIPKFCCMDPNQNKIDRRYNLEGSNNYTEEVFAEIKRADPNVKSFHVNSGRRKINQLLQAGMYQKSNSPPDYDQALQEWQQPQEVIADSSQSSMEPQEQQEGQPPVTDMLPQQENPSAMKPERMTSGAGKKVMTSADVARQVSDMAKLQSENQNRVSKPVDVEAAVEDALLAATVEEAMDEALRI